MATLSMREVAFCVLNGGWTGEDAVTGIAIVMAESGGNTTVISKADDRGLWQINAKAHSALIAQGDWRNPFTNTSMARKVYDDRGNWTPWVAYKNRSYLAHTTRARLAVRSPVRPLIGKGGKDIGEVDDPGMDLPTNPMVESMRGLADTAGSIGKGIAFITNGDNLKRVGIGGIGFLLIVVAIFKLTGDNKVSEGVKTAAMIAASRGTSLIKRKGK